MTLYIGHPEGYTFGNGELTIFDDREHYETVRGIHESDEVVWEYWEAPDWPEEPYSIFSEYEFSIVRESGLVACHPYMILPTYPETGELWAWSPDGEGVYWYTRAELFVEQGI